MLYTKISALCKEKGISVAKLEKLAGIGNGTIRHWDISAPNLNSLRRVANVLDCSVAELLEEK